MKTAAMQLIEWINENPEQIDKILAKWGGSDHAEDVGTYKETLLEQLRAINEAE